MVVLYHAWPADRLDPFRSCGAGAYAALTSCAATIVYRVRTTNHEPERRTSNRERRTSPSELPHCELDRPRCGAGSALRGSFSSRMAASYANTAMTAACWIM